MTIHQVVFVSAAAISIASAPLVAQTPAQWRLVEEWRVGGEPDGAHSFDFNFGLARLPNGGFVHFDYKTAQLHYLGARGEIVRTVGRAGGGPGETNQANGFAVTADGRIVINDRGNGRYSIFDQRGEFIGVKSATNGFSMGSQWQAMFLKDGRMIETVRLLPPEPDAMYRTLAWSADLTQSDSLSATRCDPPTGRPVSMPLRTSAGKLIDHFQIPLAAPEVPVAYDPAGFKWESRNSESNEIVRRRIGSCAVTATVRIDGSRVPLSSGLRSQMRSSATANLQRYATQIAVVVPDNIPFPETYPWYRLAIVDDSSNLWIERFVPEGRRRLEVFSPAGNHIADITGGLPPSVASTNLIIASNHVFGLETDRDGIRYLVSYRIVKP